MMKVKQSLFSNSLFVLLPLLLSFTSTIVAQSPAAAPGPSAPALSQPPAQTPSMVLTPIVPVSPSLAPSPADSAPAKPTVDIIGILRKAKRFTVLTRLLKTTQLINQLNSQLITTNAGGITIFAPDDNDFSSLKAGFLNSLNDQQKVELVNFHIMSSFISLSNFDTLTNPVKTQAGENPARLQLNITSYGNQVNMTTGVVNATISGVVYSDNKLAIYQVDKVLLPLDFFAAKSLAPAPAPAPSTADAEAPGKADKKKKSSGAADENDTASGDTDVVPVDKSAGSAIGFSNHGMWAFIAFGIAVATLSA